MIVQSAIDVDITILPVGFEEYPVAMIPPPERSRMHDPWPLFTAIVPEAPALRNGSEVTHAMPRACPPMLRDAGISGTVRISLLVDENGTAQDTRLDENSGRDALDDLALNPARTYRFSPALLHRGAPVPVRVSLPVTCRIR